MPKQEKTGGEFEPPENRFLGRDEFGIFMTLLPRWNVRVDFRQKSDHPGLVRQFDFVRFSRDIGMPGLNGDGQVRLHHRVTEALGTPDEYTYGVTFGASEEDPSARQVHISVGSWPTTGMVVDITAVETFFEHLEAGELF